MKKFVYILSGYENYSQKDQVKRPEPFSLVGDQDDNPLFIWQSDRTVVEFSTGENNSIVAKVECDPSSTTCFVANDTVVKEEFSTSHMYDGVETRLETIKDFLAKPILISTTSWTTSNGAGTDIYSTTLANVVSGNSMWTNKFAGFAFMRADIVLRFVLNAAPFHQGMLLAHYLPCAANFSAVDNNAYTNMHNLNNTQRRQQPCVEITCRDSVAIMRIPYITPSNYYDIKSTIYDWGSMWLTVFAPLKTGASGETAVNVSVYAYMENVDLMGPVVPQSSKKTKRFSAKVYDQEEKFMDSKPISSGLALVSKAASTMSSIPIIGGVADTVSWAARIGSSLASAFGYSKVDTQTPVMPMAAQLLRYGACSSGNDMSIPLTIEEDNRIAVTDTRSITNEDEMSFAFLKSVPHFQTLFTWTTGHGVGTSEYNQSISPNLLTVTGTSTYGGHTASYICGAPWVLLSGFFQYWRGSVHLHLKVVKTQFHTGILEICWNPGSSQGTAVTTSNSHYTQREILDLRYQSEVVLTLPYQQKYHYLSNNPQGFFDNISGVVQINVVNELRCPETCSQNVDVLVYYTAGDDFEYQVPGDSGLGTIPFYAQSDHTPIIWQSDEVLVDSGIAESKRFSASTSLSSFCIGEHFNSIKQLLNRFSQVYFASSVPNGNTNTTVAVWPFFVSAVSINTSSGALTSPNAGGDIFSALAPAYAFYRGSVRLAVNTQESSTEGTSYGTDMSLQTFITPTALNSVSAGITRGTRSTYNWSIHGADGTLVGNSGITETDNINNTAYCRVPYYCRTPISLVVTNTISDVIPEGMFVPNVLANFYNQAGLLTNYSLYRSFCDDFQLTFFVGMPPLLRSYV